VFTLVTTLQNRRIASQEREQGQNQAQDEQQETVFVNYINDIARYRDKNSGSLNNNSDKLLYIRTKTLTALRKLDIVRKKHVLLFLKESSLLLNDTQHLWFGADFNGIKVDGNECRFMNATFWGVQFQYVSLTNCIFENVIFRDSNFNHATLTRSSFLNTHFMSCYMEQVNFQDAIIFTVYFNGSILNFANLLHTKLNNVFFLNVNLMGAIFNIKPLDFFTIRNSILPNGTFSPVDSFYIKMDDCASLDGWFILPNGSIQVNNCMIVSTNINASMSQIVPMSLTDLSILINTNQMEFEFKIHENGLSTKILINMLFGNPESLVFDIHNIDCPVNIDRVCEHLFRVPAQTKVIWIQIILETIGASIDQISFALRPIGTNTV
ncbi:unnamed protein product, partial [Rotaria sp. Silwood2]